MAKTENEFVDQYIGPIAKSVARDLWRALHPEGMHTNGIDYVRCQADYLHKLLEPFKKENINGPHTSN